MSDRTLVIAEAACTWHIGRSPKCHLANMIKCIHIAKACDADICKFQWTSSPGEMASRRRVNIGTYHRLAWPSKWLSILAAECEAVGIEFMITCYLPSDVSVIAPYVKRFKIASLEVTDKALFMRCISFRRPALVSLGANARMPNWLIDYYDADETSSNITVLQCTLAYPAPLGSLNLNVITNCYAWMGIPFKGFSDHSGEILSGALAVACGAEIVEVHMRLDETRRDNPDFNHSHPPASLKQYITAIRKAELMLGDGLKKIEECERPLLKHQVTA